MGGVSFIRFGLGFFVLVFLSLWGCRVYKETQAESLAAPEPIVEHVASKENLTILDPVSSDLCFDTTFFNLPSALLLREPPRDSFPSRMYYGTQWDTRDIRARKSYTPSETLVLNLLPYKSDVFSMPCQGTVISEFGIRSGRLHTGDDIKQQLNDTISAVFDGVVRMARTYSGYGKLVVIRHYNGLETVYGHLNQMKVKVNDRVKSGDIIGLAGRTGRATTVHLHFEVRFKGEVLNPRLLIDFDRGMLRSPRFVLTPKSFKTYGKNFEISPDGTLISKVAATASKVKKSSAARPETVPVAVASASGQGNAVSANSQGVVRYHIVQKGDTLSLISREYQTTVDMICQLNGISAKKTLRIGEKLIIPN